MTMKIDRRGFIKTAGGIAIAGFANAVPALSRLQEPVRGRSRVAVFFDPTFVPADSPSVAKEVLAQALGDYEVTFLGSDDLDAKLTVSGCDLFITPYGSAFPKEAFAAILRFLADGGNWMNLGGVPMAVPAVREMTGWRHEIRQTSYHARLGIVASFTVTPSGEGRYEDSGELDGLSNLASGLSGGEIFELYVRFTGSKDLPSEDGSAGPRDAVLRPLVFAVDSEGRRIAAPCIAIDRLLGEFAGGRWIFVTSGGTLSPESIRLLAGCALQGSSDLSVRSSFACYHEGEIPSFTVHLWKPRGGLPGPAVAECRLDLLDGNGRRVERLTAQLRGDGPAWVGYADLASKRRSPLPPGLYEVAAALPLKSVPSGKEFSVRVRTGFWIYDRRLMEKGAPLAAGKSHLERKGVPYPVTGTTYMTSDVHRKFLLEPNPSVWSRDFADMKNAGVNMVRTGIWTGWKNYMLDVGAPSEPALRALDAFILTARKYEIPVIFTVFAFLPERWGGVNAYLDPRAVDAQKEFVTSLAQRYRTVNDLLWDFINEPSFCSPDHLWSCRPNYDAAERKAWADWLKKRSPTLSDKERTAALQERYRCTSDETLDLPKLEDFEDVNIIGDRHPTKAADYRLFAQEKFDEWVQTMKAAVRANGNPGQLTTVGQDEGGTYESPSPQFFGERVEFTSIHNWWLNDDLLWDNVMSKIPGKPNLVEETGVMFYERVDGSPWRSEEGVSRLLERKMAIALGAGAAGFIQWVWNTNPYMASDNEAAIGFLRADGTSKPELSPFLAVARFFKANGHLMAGREDEEVTMVIPHSGMFSVRSAVPVATQRCVRVMSYRCGIPINGISEYRLGSVSAATKLLVVPSPQVFNQQSWKQLLARAEAGATVLITGPCEADEAWMPVSRLKEYGIAADLRPVAEEEHLLIDGADFLLEYRGDKIQRLLKAVPSDGPARVLNVAVGKGKMIWSPLPVENSDSLEPTIALYRFALAQAGITPAFSVEHPDPSVLILPTRFSGAVLYTAVSEGEQDADVKLTHAETATIFQLRVRAQRAAMVFLDRKSGKILAQL